MTVRSTQLALGLLPGGGYTTVYTVPAGRRTIVKELSFVSGASGVLAVQVDDGSTPRQVVLRYSPALPASVDTVIPRWFVMNAGDELQIYYANSNALQYLVSGTELVL